MAELSLAPVGVTDAGAFLARLVRLDHAALVRLRRAGDDRVALWGRLPWSVLVTRTVAGSVSEDATVAGRALLDGLAAGRTALPRRLDAQWRWGLPAQDGGRVVESLPAARLRELGAAAGRALRAAVAGGVGGVPVGERAVRDALLDHVAVVVQATSVNNLITERIDIPQRLVQAVVRMGFLRATENRDEPPVRVLVAGKFVGLAGEYGVAWYRSGPAVGVRSISRTAVPG